ncbi:D-glycero-alpha-D-manno-heptose-1,7-bisphosphate 7-phosphatase [Lacibacterium aquatile]|uniref:D,D-heptose 1,7-bisphosphate phosphatase n=1 Tax=Lacibacterium aquatile TaxID=1168082 RepID=A0ABW5DXR2_9PROT
MRYKLILLDRDGVLNVDRADSVRTPEQLIMIPGAAAAVARLNRAGLRTTLCTNQSILGRGWVTQAVFDTIHDKLIAALAAEGARLDHILVAPDAPDAATPRRKPGPGMLQEALNLHGLWPDEAVMIGDSMVDAQAAKAAGVPFILVRTGKGSKTELDLPPSERLFVADDLPSAVDALFTAA